MQFKAMVGLVLVILALILIGTSLALPWYKFEVESNVMGISSSGYIEFYLDHAEYNVLGMSVEQSYDNESLKDLDYVQTFKTTQTFVYLGIVGCIIGLFGAVMVTFEKINSKIGGLLVIIAILLSLIAPFYLMFTLPSSFDEGDTDDTESDTTYDKMGEDFFGSEKIGSGDVSAEVKWGGSTGWFLAVIAMIMCIAATILVISSTSAPKQVYHTEYEPLGLYTKPTTKKTYEEDYWLDLESDEVEQPEVYRTEQPETLSIFEPIPSASSGHQAGQRMRFKCPECGRVLIISVPKRPLGVTCNSCGLKGIVE